MVVANSSWLLEGCFLFLVACGYSFIIPSRGRVAGPGPSMRPPPPRVLKDSGAGAMARNFLSHA